MSPGIWQRQALRNDTVSGHYERSDNDGKTWTRVVWKDVDRAIGRNVARTLRRESCQARPYPRSQWGILYRWVPKVSAEQRKAG